MSPMVTMEMEVAIVADTVEVPATAGEGGGHGSGLEGVLIEHSTKRLVKL